MTAVSRAATISTGELSELESKIASAADRAIGNASAAAALFVTSSVNSRVVR